ncbi:MAG: hypothetical protein Q4D65_09775 [Peptostreptococcaceae bacterium]|nr:hypothetical protein [Peptostreptococcaceae bacterium]
MKKLYYILYLFFGATTFGSAMWIIATGRDIKNAYWLIAPMSLNFLFRTLY